MSPLKTIGTDLTSVVIQKSLCFVCHSGLDPESSVFELDSRFCGDDDFGKECKELLDSL